MLKSGRRLPPLNSLRAFEAAARHRSITRAAEELGVTQSAVSHHVRTLEDLTGVTLLDRRGNSFSLTAAGLRTLGLLSGGFNLIADAIASLETPDVSGEVVVSCPPALTALWLVKNIGQFLIQHPGIRLGMRSSTEWNAVIGSDVDLCIRYGDGIWQNRRTSLLSKVDLFPVCSPEIAAGINSYADLQNAPLLYAADDSEWNGWLSSAQINTRPLIRHYMGNDFTTIEAAVNGFGVAIGDSVTCQHYLRSGALVAPFDHRHRSGYSFHLIERANSSNKIAVARVRDWIVSCFANGLTD